MSRVFVTQQPRANKQGWTPNLTSAARYGALHYVFSGSDQPHTDPDGAIFQAAGVLSDFDPQRDYILWPNVGDPAAVMATMIVLARKELPFIKCLSWERRMVRGNRSLMHGFYVPITFNLPPFSDFRIQ